jgi:hypothetical protein
VTNHTVTIAAELVSLFSKLTIIPGIINIFLLAKENGEKLVGQCEISHPVSVQITTPSISINGDSGPISPVDDDGLDRALCHRQNVMFEPQAKNQYDSLTSRILSRRISAY